MRFAVQSLKVHKVSTDAECLGLASSVTAVDSCYLLCLGYRHDEFTARNQVLFHRIG